MLVVVVIKGRIGIMDHGNLQKWHMASIMIDAIGFV
jgi:hypothetical protein